MANEQNTAAPVPEAIQRAIDGLPTETLCKRRSKNPSVKRPIRSVAPE